MPFTQVTDLPSIDLDLIDSDHLTLARRVEAVREAIAAEDSARIDRALDCMREFALTHYGLEESMMLSSNYPEMREHVRMHQRLIGVLNRLIDRRRRENTVFTSATMRAIEELHTMHMLTDDARLGQWLHARMK